MGGILRSVVQENVDAVRRIVEAGNRRDIDAILAELDGAVEWHDAAPMLLGGEATVYVGHVGVRALFTDLWDVLDEIAVEFTEIRDLGERIVGTGRLHTRGRASGVETESPYGGISDWMNGKAVRVWTYLDPKEALEAAGLSA